MQTVKVGDRVRYRKFYDSDMDVTVLQGIGRVSAVHLDNPPIEVDGDDRFFGFEIGILG